MGSVVSAITGGLINGGGSTSTVSTSTSFSTTTTVSSKTNVSVSRVNSATTEIIPFMRPITITFQGERFRPYSEVKAYFNGVDVSSYISTSYSGNKIVAGADGSIYGTFAVPANTFTTGDGVMVIADDFEPSNAISYGAVGFSSGGTLIKNQTTITTTNTTVNTTTVINTTTNTTTTTVQGGDPLAQTFFISTKTNSPGCFITKIGIFFKTKDPVEPVELELRNVENGYPGETVIASAIVKPDFVGLSSLAASETFFKFDRPIFVNNNSQYCFVLKTNSTKYNVWVATMGENCIDRNESVAKQPNAGVMFVSSNDTTWTADQLSDVKFNVYVAKFTTGTASLSLAPSFPLYQSAYDANIQTYVGTKRVRVFALNHGLEVGSKTKVTMSLPVGITTANGIPSAELTGTKTVTAIDAFSFSFNASTNASSDGLVTASLITYEPNCTADAIQIMLDTTTLENTSIDYGFKGVSGRSIHGTQTPFIQDSGYVSVDNYSVYRFVDPKVITSYNDTSLRFGGNVPTRVSVTLKTSDPYVSPFMKLDASGMLAISHHLNNPTSENSAEDWVPETSTEVPLSAVRYVTKPITLSTPATSLKVMFAGNVVNGNDVDVYYRFTGSAEEVGLDTKNWTLFSPNTTFIHANERGEFYDYEYDKSEMEEYLTFQVKLVLRGTKSSIPPIIRDFRVLALAV